MDGKSAAPERSLAQRMEALRRANEIRMARADLKRRIRAGMERPEAVLREPSADVATMKVGELLLAKPKWGRVKVNKTLGRTRISPSKTVGGLSERQRRELVEAMAGREPARPLITHPTNMM